MDIDPISWMARARQFNRIRNFFDIAGDSAPWLAALVGWAGVTTIVGLFTEHPSVAMTLGVVCGFYGFQLFERGHLWWRKENLTNKLLIIQSQLHVDCITELHFNVSVLSTLFNNADYDIAYAIDDEDFFIDAYHAKRSVDNTTHILPAKKTTILASLPITNVAINSYDRVTSKFCIRYGRSTKKLPLRWFVVTETSLPTNLASSESNVGLGHMITRNDLELIST